MGRVLNLPAMWVGTMLKTRCLILGISACLFLLSATGVQAAPNLVTNGNFALGSTSGATGWNNYSATYATANSWTYTYGSPTNAWNTAIYATGSLSSSTTAPLAVSSGLAAVPGGGYAQALSDGQTTDSITQVLTTTVGATYQVSFDYYVDQHTTGITANLAASLGGFTGYLLNNAAPSAYNVWMPELFIYTATSTASTLSFTGGDTWWQFVSNLTVTQVPEPPVVLLLGGCALLLVTTRRQASVLS